MKVSIVYALAKRQIWLNVEVPEDATLREAVERSGLLAQCPEIDLDQQKVGVFGKVSALETKLADGDRVEIYRPLIADPKTLKGRTKGEETAAPSAKTSAH
ncbi:RnfH family protein [Thiocystis minor]|uniref:RnfH family protein n=1 Tax=Thiocystis minor TaxID=61597 RepID=UPI001911B91A|nr:RnfH family protein [Thiocystis minor]MBK5965524.1 RnfH family protein [Thiocystis minor]